MTAVKNTSQISGGAELRDLFSLNQVHDKKGSSGDLSTQFWELLNKLDDESQSSSAKTPPPSGRSMIRHEKHPISPMEKKSTVIEDVGEISLSQQEDFTSPVTMTELVMVRPQQLIDTREEKPMSPGGSGKDKVLDGIRRGEESSLKGVKEPLKLNQGGGQEILLPHPSGEEGTFLTEKFNHSDPLKQALAHGGKENKIQFEMMAKPMDPTPLQVRPTTISQDKPKVETEITSEEVPQYGEKSQLLSMPTKTKQTYEMERGRDGKEQDVRGTENVPLSSSPAPSTMFVKPTGLMETASMSFKGNNSSQVMVGSALKGTEQTSGKPGLIEAKKMTSAEKIQMLNQIRSELKATLEKGETHLKVHLSPDELGKVEIKLDIDRNGTVQILFTADQRETMEHIARHGHEFVQIFQDSGLQADLSSMNFQSRQQHQEGGDSKTSRMEPFSMAPGASQEAHPVKLRRATTQIDIEV